MGLPKRLPYWLALTVGLPDAVGKEACAHGEQQTEGAQPSVSLPDSFSLERAWQLEHAAGRGISPNDPASAWGALHSEREREAAAPIAADPFSSGKGSKGLLQALALEGLTF